MSIEAVAIIGTGNVGANLGRQLAKAGVEVRFGVRPGKDIGELVESITAAGGRAQVASPSEAAAGADAVLLAVPANAALDAAHSAGELSGKILVDCTNPVRWDAGPVWNPPEAGSVSAALAEALPGARVVKAFNGFGAEFHANPSVEGDTGISLFMASDDAEAKADLSTLTSRAGFSPVDAGPLRNASVLENTAILWIHLATVGGQGRDFALQKVTRR